eukprot:336519_1
MKNFQHYISRHPELIGWIPFCPAEEQSVNAFDYWLWVNKNKITAEVKEISMFMTQISTLQTDRQDWISFIHGWKLHRIFHKDDFKIVWGWVVTELNIELKNAKQEVDEETEQNE